MNGQRKRELVSHNVVMACIFSVSVLHACAPVAPGGPQSAILASPQYQSAQMCEAYATGLQAATARANAGELTVAQDAAIDQVVQSYGPLCVPTVNPDAYLHYGAMIDSFSRAGIVIAAGSAAGG